MRFAIYTLATLGLAHAASAQGSYVVQPGDTLRTIAQRELGDVRAWRSLCDLNRLSDCDRILSGMMLELPTTPDSAADEATHTAPQPETTETDPDAAASAVAPTEQGVETYALGTDLGLPFNTSRGYQLVETDAGVTLSGHVENAGAGGQTGGAFIRLSDAFEEAASGNRIRIEITATGPEGGTIAAAYSTAEVGNSGWRTLPVGPEPTVTSFEYNVPPMVNGNGDFLGIQPDPENTGASVTMLSIRLDVLSD
ncbi:LysM peptidoglycan-binding domain-containing protein [Roseinatronobacter sp. NSM]|uniref:LysM peptidoglycan-binding domain-containing protein n=1 Tax=Roseinatronobacter sp. NSM TaxID=3457785 RepID=UPI004035AFD0